VSVKAVAHYPSALNMMADKIDWTAALGRAYAVQSSDVMIAVQRMRAMADAQGNLQSSEQQTVIRDEGNYVIAPTQTRVIYVPVYDPYVVYTRPIFRSGFRTSFWSFGVGFPIGAWLNYDFNWSRRNVYYNGWDRSYYGYAGGWRQRSRPFINVTNIYINPRYRSVYINRDIVRRRVIYQNVDRYPGVHRDTRFSRGPVIYRGGQRSVGYGGFDRRDDRRDDRGYDRNRSSGTDRRTDRRDDRTRSVIVPQGQGGSIGRPYDGRDDRGGTRGNGTWGRDGDSRGGRRTDDMRGGGATQRESQPSRRPEREERDGSRGRGNGGGFGGGSPSGMARGPERNEGPMINPRRAERGEPGAQGNGRGRGGREGRERP
jgi:hypothetical protein